MVFAAENAAAQATATESDVPAAARIMTILAIDNTTTLHFGDIVPSGTEGTVTVTPAGVRSSTGGVTLLEQVTTHTAAVFDVDGEENLYYTVSLPADAVVSLTGAGDPMAVNTFTHNSTEQLDASGEETFNVGATLSVGINQDPGLYEGTFDVTVTYD